MICAKKILVALSKSSAGQSKSFEERTKSQAAQSKYLNEKTKSHAVHSK
jgi:hypothetical protein